MNQTKYKDEKGRVRWSRNDEIAKIVKQLGEFLIIGGYPENHAKRYAQLSYTISRWPESVEVMSSEDRLNELPGVGGVVASYVQEIVETGYTSKFEDDQYGNPPPRTVLEMTSVKGLGAKTVKTLYQEHGITSLNELCEFLDTGCIDQIKGIGMKTRDQILDRCLNRK